MCLTQDGGVCSRDGWVPICAFLGLEGTECPTTPYPRMNDAAELGAVLAVFEFVTSWWGWIAVGLYAAVGITVGVLWMLFKGFLGRRKAKGE